MPANGGNPRRVAGEFVSARNPIWSPDGRGLLFFGRRSESSPVLPRMIGPNVSPLLTKEFDWWYVPAQGGEPIATGVYPALLAKGISFAPDTGGDSLPDSWGAEGVLFSATTGQATNLWRVKVSLLTGKIDGAPVRLTTGAGADYRPSVDKFGHVVFQVSRSNEAVFALSLEQHTGKSLGRIDRLATGDARSTSSARSRPTARCWWSSISAEG